MRLTPKHVGMEIQWYLKGEATNLPWTQLIYLFKLGKETLVLDGAFYEDKGFVNDKDWRVRKPQKKTRRKK